MRFYRGLRRDVSLLMDHGHPRAREYPIAVIWSESRIVRKREATRMQQEALLLHAAVAALLAGGDTFNEMLKEVGNVG